MGVLFTCERGKKTATIDNMEGGEKKGDRQKGRKRENASKA